MNKNESHIVPELKQPVRLQEYGVGIFSSAPTKSALKKALKKGFITVDKAIGTTATFIRGGEVVTLNAPIISSPTKKLVLPLNVLFEDEHIAAINKPAGILVSGNGFKTIANALQQNLKPSQLPDGTLAQPVHRLDYATTGILLVGKTSSAIRKLNQLFEDRAVKKEYLAVTIGEMNPDGQISSPVDGKEACTNYRVLASVPSSRFGKLNLVSLEPKTGRKHQLRVHLSELGHPILGDPTYGDERFRLKGKGLYLHARSIQFAHPFTHENLHLKSPVPRRFEKLFSGQDLYQQVAKK